MEGSQKSPRARRQRTTSMNQSSKKTATESMLRTQYRTIYTAGRPPWYNSAGQQVEPFVIGKLNVLFLVLLSCFFVFYYFKYWYNSYRNMWRKCLGKDNSCSQNHSCIRHALGHPFKHGFLLQSPE